MGRSQVLNQSGRGGRVLLVGVTLVLIGLLAGSAWLIRSNDADAHHAVSARFLVRAGLTAEFAQSDIYDLASRERDQAARLLAGPVVTRAAFEAVVESFDLSAAGLFDSQGRLLQVYPSKPALIGHDLTAMYPHVKLAVEGHIGVSPMVKSAVAHIAVAGVAVPYNSADGRRVFSGAFSPSITPLGSYLDTAVNVTGSSAYLVDLSGNILASSHASTLTRAQLAPLRAGIGVLDTKSGPVTAAVADVPGAPWRIVIAAPDAGLYASASSFRWAPWLLWLALAFAGILAIVLFVRLGRARADAAESARTDALTGLPNRRAMQEAMNRVGAVAARHEVPLAALMIDIDRFKLINDTYGHDVGDLVIRATAAALEHATRAGDIAGRWGGEEFLVLLQHTDAAGVLVVAERVRRSIAAAVVPGHPVGGLVTASIGMAVMHGDDTAALLRDADTALYAAKANGRNRVEACSPAVFEHTTEPAVTPDVTVTAA